MRPFAYASVGTVDEALALLGDGVGDGVRPLAGGTDLLTLMKGDIATPSRLVDIRQAGVPDTIEEARDGLVLGGLATLAQIETSAPILDRYPALAQAAAVAATPQIRNMATIAGNLLQRPRCWYFRQARFHCWLKGGDDCPAREGENQLHAIFGDGPCHAVHPSDLAPALIAYEAEARLRGPRGERTLPVAALFAPPEADRRRETVLRDDELLISLRLPPADGSRSTYVKAMDRTVWAFALVAVAACLRLDGPHVADARLVLTGVAPVPWRAHEAERVLVGAELGGSVIERAGQAAVAGAAPLRHNAYKVPLARALVRRALETLA